MHDRLQAELRDRLLGQLRHAAADGPPLIAIDYPLGSTGITVDLAVAAEEFIGIVIHVGDEPPDRLEDRLTVCARYFHRLVVVGRPADVDGLRSLDLAGAAVWAIDAGGDLLERKAGRPHRVGAGAFLDLVPPDRRAALVGPAIPGTSVPDRQGPLPTGEPVAIRSETGPVRPPTRYWSSSVS